MTNAERAKLDAEIKALIYEYVPPPLVVSDTAIRQLEPLLVEFLKMRRERVAANCALGMHHERFSAF